MRPPRIPSASRKGRSYARETTYVITSMTTPSTSEGISARKPARASGLLPAAVSTPSSQTPGSAGSRRAGTDGKGDASVLMARDYDPSDEIVNSR